MKIGSLFSGYGGLDMGVGAVLGGSLAWHVDNDPAAAKLLAHRWPEVPNLGDITGVDWSAVEPVDVVTGGWPCQPWSVAGKRKGIADERALWPEVVRALRVLRPRYVVLENVPGILAAGELARVAGDLAALGYRFAWACVRAAEVGAPHRRERMFIVAAEDSDGQPCAQWWKPAPGEEENGRARPDAGRRGRAPAADASGEPLGHQPVTEPRRGGPPVAGFDRAAPADPDNQRPADQRQVARTRQRALARTSRRTVAHAQHHGRREGEPRTAGSIRGSHTALCGDAAATDADCGRRRRHTGTARREQNRRDAVNRPRPSGVEWGVYGPAIRRWEGIVGRPAPAPTQAGRRGGQQLSPWFVEFLMGLDHGHVCDVPDLSRNDRLRLLGNGVVPQQAETAVRWLLGILTQKLGGTP